ncbi:hypothetical protein ACE6H2_001263 [Prunus campanulata]
MPCRALNMESPYSKLFHKEPNLTNLKVFGCACYPLLHPYNQFKVQPRSKQCVFLGYALDYKGYLCLQPHNDRIYISRHVIFDEDSFPFRTTSFNPPTTDLSSYRSVLSSRPIVSQFPSRLDDSQVSPVSLHSPVPHTRDTISSSPIVVTNGSIEHVQDQLQGEQSSRSPGSIEHVQYQIPDEQSSQSPASLSDASASSFVDLVVDLSEPAHNVHPMQTRSKSGILKPRKGFLAAKTSCAPSSLTEPHTYSQAAKIPEWTQAMVEEFQALEKQKTWTLVPYQPSMNVVGCKWVFKLKRNADGSVSRHKAQLVAKGFHQEAGLDYDETFSLVVKHSTVRLVLALAAQFHWTIKQLDVKNAFLHGILHEEVYMQQPPGFTDSKQPHHVCRLLKSLYGLKQAPRAWNERFTTHLLTLGFVQSLADTSLFVLASSRDLIILLLYVDDIILTGNNMLLIQQTITALGREFDMKDLGKLTYFLGLQVQYTSAGIHVNQSKYATVLDGVPLSDPALYRSLVGGLQYLTFSRPDIAFAVNTLCQFMHTPTEPHFAAVKRVLRYLAGTLTHGIHFTSGDVHLQAYSDADWAGDVNDRRSTTGYVVFLDMLFQETKHHVSFFYRSRISGSCDYCG